MTTPVAPRLTCDVCSRVVNEGTPGDTPRVWVHDEGCSDEAHACDACYDASTHVTYVASNAYTLICRFNARTADKRRLSWCLRQPFDLPFNL